MPMIRYQIRSEYGLADPELYRASDKDDPEALLEGVAMAGLVGVLRQLGDLAEFAAEIFHELHEEVMATAGRGHGLMLRVQQLEAEFPSIEKAFLPQTSHSHLAYNSGIDWHANIQNDQNLITRGDMPRFILDSYEECRGPPRLFVLDKFDVAGAGACLKRYSDPSFFKVELASSGTAEADIQREKRVRKIKKKASRWKNGEADSPVTPLVNSNQPENPPHASEKIPMRRVKLKSRHLKSMDTNSRRSYMECVFEAHPPEQGVLLENSLSQSNRKIKSIQSALEVHEIIIADSDECPSFGEKSPTQPLTEQITELPMIKLEIQKTNGKVLSETLSNQFGDVDMYSNLQIVEQKEMFTDYRNKTEVSTNLQELEHSKLSGNPESITEGFADGYRSDDIGSEVDNFVDALNTLESETEIDSESRARSGPGLIYKGSKGVFHDHSKRHQVLLAQSSDQERAEDQMAQSRLDNMRNKGIPSFSDSENINWNDTQAPRQKRVSFDETANSKICLVEKHDRISREVMESSDEDCNAEAAITSNFRSEAREASSSSCVTNSTFTLRWITSKPSTETPSCHVNSEHELAEHLDDKIPSATDNCKTEQLVAGLHGKTETSEDSELPSHVKEKSILPKFDIGSKYLSDALLNASDITSSNLSSKDFTEKTDPIEHADELITEDTTGTVNVSILEQVLTGDVEDVMLQEPESSQEDIEACPIRSLLPTTSTLSNEISSPIVQPNLLAAGMENDLQPDNFAMEASAGSERDTYEVAEDLDGNLPCTTVDHEFPSVSNGNGVTGDLFSYSELAGSPIEGRYFDENANSAEEFEEENAPQVHVGYVKGSPLLSTLYIGEPQEPSGQHTEDCSDGFSPCSTPGKSHASTAGIENFVALGVESSYPRLESVDLEIANDETQEYSGEETLPDESHMKTISEVSNLHMDLVEIEEFILSDESLTKYIVAEDVDGHGPSLTCSTEVSASPVQAQEDSTLVDADPNRHILGISEASSPNNKTKLDSASEISSSELSSQDSFDSSDSMLVNDIRHTATSEHAETGSTLKTDEEKPIHSADRKQDFSTKESVKGSMTPFPVEEAFEEQAGNEPNTMPSYQEHEIAQSGEQDDIQSNSIELDDGPLGIAQSGEQDDIQSNSIELDDGPWGIAQSGEPDDIQSNFVDADPNQHILDISEASSPNNKTKLNSASVISSYEFSSQDLFDSSDFKSVNDICHPAASEHTETGLTLRTDEENQIHSADREQDFSTKESLKGGMTAFPVKEAFKAQTGKEPNIVPSYQEHEIAQSGEQDDIQTNSLHIGDRPSELGPEHTETGLTLRTDEENQIHSADCEQDFSTKGSLKGGMTAFPVDEAFKAQTGNEPNIMLSYQEHEIAQSDEQDDIQTNSLQIGDRPSELGPEQDSHAMDDEGNVRELDILPSNTGFPFFASSGLSISESTLQKISEPEALLGFMLDDIHDTPPLPPLPPLEWRTGKLRPGSQSSDGNLVQPSSETNPFSELSIIEGDRHQHDTKSLHSERLCPLRLSELPPIIEDERHHLNLVPSIEDDMRLYSHDALCGGVLQLSNTFAPLKSPEVVPSKYLYQSPDQKLEPLEDKGPQLGRLLDVERSQHVLSNEREMLQSTTPYFIESSIEVQNYLYNYGFYGGEDRKNLYFSAPMEGNPFAYSDGIIPTSEDENRNGKTRSIRNRPRHPLIDAVAAHDKSKLRKVSELVQPSTKPKADEKDTLLEQIRNKSFSLKPAAPSKLNTRGPPTNLKVAAILEKANAIRQACAGSDEDDDRDSWSDS